MRTRRRSWLIVALAALLVAAGVVTVARTLPASADPANGASSAPVHAAAARVDVRSHWFRMSTVLHEPLVPDRSNYAARSSTGGPLLLLLSATGHQPRDYTRFLRLAADDGYHVLGLDYWNLGHSVASTCATDASCYGRLQRNRFDGSRPFAKSRVAPQDSVLGRLEPALAHLREQDPHGGWGNYLEGGTVRWDRIVLAGHSQGGGEAAYIAHIRAVRGALLFGSPIVSDGRTAATWLSTPSRTPASRIYAFDNTSDQFWPRIEPSWRRLGLGTPQVVDGTTHYTSHALISEVRQAHAHLWVLDDATPKDAAGVPVYRPVWDWMLHRFLPARTARA
ncbi:BPSS1187 family protein [Amnibacterium kyonggiense]